MVMYVDSKASSHHPVVLTAHLDPGLSRWKWLVKWFLAIPHYLWIYRVIAYAGLMTDQYPPFRLDQSGTEPTLRPLPPTIVPAIPPAPETVETWTGA